MISQEVSKFASDKKLEIEALKVREEYRREFLGNISHELKTPLFTVQGYVSTLLDGGMKDKTIRKKYLARALNGVDRLIYIVEDLDTISKLEISDEPITMAPFDIIPLIQNVMDLLEMKANKKDILMTFDDKYIKPIKEGLDKITEMNNTLEQFKKKGYTIFMLENNNSVNDKPDRVGIFKTTDKYKILRDIKTSAFNYDIDNDSLIHIIERWDKDLDLELIGASGDYCEFLINKDPQNWRELAQQIYNICPDVVNQGTGYLVVYKNEMMKNKRLYLWWD